MYDISITYAEAQNLFWFSERGYFPEALAVHIASSVNEQVYQKYKLEKAPYLVRDIERYTVEIPEHVAWELLEMEMEDEAFLTCMEESLAARFLTLTNQIV